MTQLSDQYDFRDMIVDQLSRDLLGPSAPDEVLDESPLDRYLTGILYPAGRAENAEEADEPDVESSGPADSSFDPGTALAQMKYPSSFGMSLAVDTRIADAVSIQLSTGRYEPIDLVSKSTGDESDSAAQAFSRSRRPRTGSAWQRVELSPPVIAVPTSPPGVRTIPMAEGLALYVFARPANDGIVRLTVILRNTQLLPAQASRDPYCWFQPSISVRTEPAAIVAREARRETTIEDEDLDSYDLLFRSSRSFAVGHGCAADWALTEHSCVAEVRTTFVPRFELRLSTPGDASADTDLRMVTLATSEIELVLGNLRALNTTYRAWIAGRTAESELLAEHLVPIAHRHLANASTAAERIEQGIEYLAQHPDAMRAFRLMNRAMQDQRARQDWIRSGASGLVPDGSDQAWRPFQIAFILLNLAGLADPRHGDRDKADLLWFPTGGGKTEAYLGLIAFTILLRRFRNPYDRGVAVLMRYTLRLLTLQQFERAATLICGLELIRLSDEALRLGEPVSLGLWVGQGATPNTLKDAAKGLSRLAAQQEPEKGNPAQLTRCPWCGVGIDHTNYTVDRGPIPSLRIACRNRSCEFRDGLPLYLVDEDVYRVRPSLLIGTVDKFALMAWNAEVRSIFSSDGAGLPPDLIVQDELHLISGPLGTLVGLYETAVDAAASGDSRPKLVASTATIRRASAQIRAVFDRESFQFPPPGLDLSDSFFAVEADRSDKGTREYVGLLAPGTSPATLLVRTYASLLQSGNDLPAVDAVRDPYWSLVGYFNSLRVLGGAFMQVIDDVPDRLRVLAKRGGGPARSIVAPLELTSRIESSRVPLALAQLGESFPSENSPSVVLATNMISVGVDVDRLGLMAVMGQPQATAEYIQATSRVGRKYPGLVVVMYNAARSRDRSHYESFLRYHQTLYREVEATSATPFAARARDRGLHGVLVSLARLLIPSASAGRAAANIASYAPDVEAIAMRIVQRAGRVDSREALDTNAQLQALVDTWLSEAAAKGQLQYSVWNEPGSSLLVDAGRALTDPDLSLDTVDCPWPTLTSLRDVDAESSLYLMPNYDGRS